MSKGQFKWGRGDDTPLGCIEKRMTGEGIKMLNIDNSAEAFSMKKDQRNRKITGRLIG